MSLSLQAIDRLFARLNVTYGRDFMARWEGQDVMAVKSSWAHELAGFENHLHSIAWALENLPDRAPNIIEFRALCRKSPAADLPRLPEPKADLARVNAELAKLAPIKETLKNAKPHDFKAWAYALQARDKSGEKLNMTVRTMYRQALGIEP